MRPSLPTRLFEWFQALPDLFRGASEPAAGVIAARLVAGDSLGAALERGLPPIGAEATRVGLSAEDGPVALVCVDLLRSLDGQLQVAARQLEQAQEPWALWTAQRLLDFAAALDDELVHTHLVNAVLSEAGVTSELIPIEVRRLSRRRLEAKVVEVLLRMRSTVFTPADLAQTASTLGRPVRTEQRLADA
ncbi:MAG: hypothetical protein SFW67_07180 [Myxococcaceae bacterium]|nr:hypothetical protein [Myxococcaceae bacterium]